MNPQIQETLKQAVECSYFQSPTEPGLTVDELIEVGSRFELQRGEVLDAVSQSRFGHRGHRLELPEHLNLTNFNFPMEPDYRDINAFHFVIEHLLKIGRAETMANAKAPRGVIVANGVAAGHKQNDLEVAITLYLNEKHLIEKDGFITFAPGRHTYALPKAQVDTNGRIPPRQRPRMQAINQAVQDVIRRRQDGRAPTSEPLPAFGSRLERLGHGRFRLWWTHMCAELQAANPAFAPVTVCVLAAALSEGALTFIVKHAQSIGAATMNSKTFTSEPPTRWGFDDVLKSAAFGGADAVFDQNTRDRADRLFLIRQRIHAGRLLGEHPTGPIADIRPEEAREALDSLNVIVRKILDWLDKHPVVPLTS